MSILAIHSLILAILSPANAPVPPLNAAVVRKELDAAWQDLLSRDEQVATRAVLKFATRQDYAVDYLHERLQPLKLTKERADKLLVELADKNPEVARKAFEEFSYFDLRLAYDDTQLRAALLDKPVSRRLGAVLLDLPIDAFSAEKWHWYSPDNVVLRFNCGEAIYNQDTPIGVELVSTMGRKAAWVRAIRAIAVLEFLDTPKARATLKRMALGHGGAAPTQAAMRSCERLVK